MPFVERAPVLYVQLAVGVIHAVGMFGEAVIIISVLAFKPLACMNNFAVAPAGTNVVPELTAPAPKDSVTLGVTVNVAVPMLP